MMKIVYAAPCVLKKLPVELESDFLAGSTVTKNTKVKSTGQETVSYDFSDTQFNQQWGE